MTIWFTSDLHFGHRKMAELRGYLNNPTTPTAEAVVQMNEALIDNYNSCVGKKDQVYILGDFSFQNEALAIEMLYRLNGQIILIEGNHDRKRKKLLRAFPRVEKLMEFKIDGQHIVCCHFPLYVWNKHHHGAWHLHGHCHGTLMKTHPEYYERKVMDVGVDCHNLFPIPYEDIKRFMDLKKIVPVDHHGSADDYETLPA